MNNFTIIDVETASRRVPSICSLGLVHVSRGKVTARHHYYVKPRGRFEYWNIRVHGIEPYQVKSAPSFKDVWPLIKDYCENSIIIAHNASFDMAQIQASLEEAGIDCPDFYYIDTVKMASSLFPSFPKYNLAYLSLVMDVDLGNHHDALSDASATSDIFQWMQKRYPLQRSNISIYKSPKKSENRGQDFLSKFDELNEILKGLEVEGPLGEEEKNQLEDWISSLGPLKDCYPARELVPRLEFILKKAIYDEGVHLIIDRLSMNFYREKTRINFNQSFREALNFLVERDAPAMARWLEENFAMRDEYLFEGLWRGLWEFHYHEKGSRASLEKRLRFFINPFDGSYSKERVAGKEGILIGRLNARKTRDFHKELASVGARLVDKNPRYVDFVIVASGKKGLDYTPKIRKLLKLKEEGLGIDLLKIARR